MSSANGASWDEEQITTILEEGDKERTGGLTAINPDKFAADKQAYCNGEDPDGDAILETPKGLIICGIVAIGIAALICFVLLFPV